MKKQKGQNKEIKGLLQEQMDSDLERVMEEINNDPNLKDVEAPDRLHEKLIHQIHEYEAEMEKGNLLTDEEKELMRLGKVYKKRKKRIKYYVLPLAAIWMLAAGINSVGGPKRVFQEVRWMLGRKEQTNIDTDDERLVQQDEVTEVDAYEQIEEEFNFTPVSFHYLPQKMVFTEMVIDKDIQNIRLFYEKGEEKVLSCTILPNYRTVTIGTDVEDTLVDEFSKSVQEVDVAVKEYLIEESAETRWRAEFQYNDVQYFVMMSGFTEEEMEQTVENLFFSK